MKKINKMRVGAIFTGKNATAKNCHFSGPDAGLIDMGTGTKLEKSKAYVSNNVPHKAWYKRPEIITPIILALISLPWWPNIFDLLKGY